MSTSDAPAGTLLSDLAKVGETLVSSEIPAATDLAHVVGAVIKTLEASGTTVPDELKQPQQPSDTPAAPEVAQAPSGPDEQTESRLSSLEDKLSTLIDRLGDR